VTLLPLVDESKKASNEIESRIVVHVVFLLLVNQSSRAGES
jgi:hypothetical protein